MYAGDLQSAYTKKETSPSKAPALGCLYLGHDARARPRPFSIFRPYLCPGIVPLHRALLTRPHLAAVACEERLYPQVSEYLTYPLFPEGELIFPFWRRTASTWRSLSLSIHLSFLATLLRQEENEPQVNDGQQRINQKFVMEII